MSLKSSRSTFRARLRQLLRATVWAALGVTVLAAQIWLSGRSHATQTDSVPTTVTGTAESAVRLLTGDRPDRALAALPADFPDVLGYRPHLIDGHPVNPTGECSSPIPLPASFETACQTHDFGYDLLRYAKWTGRPLDDWARAALDRALIDRLRADCGTPACLAAVELSRAGLGINTWRQDYGPPAAAESVPQIVASVVLRVTAAVTTSPVPGP